MKKLILAVLLVVALLCATNVSYGENDVNANGQSIAAGGDIVQGDVYNDYTGGGDTEPQVIAKNGGSGNPINITSNSDDHSMWVAPPLLNPTASVPLAEELPYEATHQFYLTKSIFKLQKNEYTVKELTSFANPGRFLGILWPEWNSCYTTELALYRKAKPTKTVRVVEASKIAGGLGLIKIGEGSCYATQLNKSEHQVMSALAVQAANVGANIVVFKTHSNPIVKIESFVIGGGGLQTSGANAMFNGAAGIGSSTSEKLTRAWVVAEFYTLQ